MATQTLRPDSTFFDGGPTLWSRTGGTTKHGVLADDADGTYVSAGSTSAANLIVDLTSYTLLAGERVKRYRARCRGWASGSGKTVQLDIGDTSGGSFPEIVRPALTLPTSIAERSSAWFDDDMDLADQQDLVDGLAIRVFPASGSSGTLNVAEVYLDLDVWQRVDAPTVTAAEASAGTISTTDLPTIQSYTANLNDGTPSLYSRQVRVFRDAVYLAGGFDPETETDVEWEQSDTSMAGVSSSSGAPDELQVAEPLANSDTYRAYVRYGKNDVAGQTLWSEWGYVEFTLSLTLPSAPSLDVEVDQAEGRQAVTITTAALTHDTLESIRLERSDDGGTTWATVRDGFLTSDPDDGSALAGSTAYTLHDYDAPRDTELIYRARVVEGITSSGTTLTSAWTTADSVAHPNDGQWWIYDVDQWTDVLAGARIVEGPEIEVAADVGVFHPLGRTGSAVVVSGTVHGDDGSYELRATGTAECDAVDPIARYAGTLLVKSPFGDQKYVRWITRSRRLLGTPTAPRHLWALGYAEVDADIGDDG